jgi:membrane-bound serine protease (ClpP class)
MIPGSWRGSEWAAFADEGLSLGKSGIILEIKGPVGPAVADYLVTELDKANAAGIDIIIIEMDTPGGLDTSMREIIKSILASSSPVVTYVSPPGARAASAGLYILVASHVAAMAPGTNTGAATPVEIGGGSMPIPRRRDEGPEPGGDDDELAEEDVASDRGEAPALGNREALRAKVINDATAYIRSLAEMRGRNVEWVERAVTAAESLSASEALQLNVIDLVASDISSLVAQLEGLEVELSSGEVRQLSTEGIVLERVVPGWLTRFLAFISNPNVAFIFMSIGTTGIIIEMWNPGGIFPGTLGVVSLIIGLYSFQVLPVNWAGAALVGIGIVLIMAEAYTPSLGLLGFFGLALFVSGSLLLFPSDTPGFTLSRTVIFSVSGVVALFLGAILFAVAETRHRGAVTGSEAMQGRSCTVTKWEGCEGWVILDGELWKARSEDHHEIGETADVVDVDGLIVLI